MKECYTTKSNVRNTAGEYETIVVCYCGTTACTKDLIGNYPLPKDFNKVTLEPISKEDEERFYKVNK